MDNSESSCSFRNYSEVLLEEIALEGLDGITLDLLWNRLKINSEWQIPIDEFVEDFIWKTLISVDHLDWYAMKDPRETPPVFASTEEFLEAVEAKKVDAINYGIKYYPHNLINDGEVIGSCSTYHERKKVTNAVRTLTLQDVRSKFGNRLVLVASQSVRNFVLITPDTNPSFELSDVSYCILERIGRGRRCGEFSVALNFMKNGANPTFYYWNKLRKINIIKTQQITNPRQVRGTLLHLTKFYRRLPSETHNLVLQVTERILASPVKMCLFSDAKDLFSASKTKKFTKSEVFRRYIKVGFVPYEQYYPEFADKKPLTKNGSPKLIRVLQVVAENYDELLRLDDDNGNESVHELGLLRNVFLFNRTAISQSYHLIRKSGDQGLSMVDLEEQLGVSKLLARMMLKALQRFDLIVSVSSDDARKRFYKYYSKDYYSYVKSKIEEQVKCSEMMNISAVDEMNLTGESSKTDINNEVTLEKDEVLIHHENNEATENTECDSNENPEMSEIIEMACKQVTEATKRQSSTDINKLDEMSVKRPKLENPSQDFLQNQIMSAMSEPIKCPIPAGESIFVMRRINIVLNHVYKYEVIHRVLLPKIIVEEETKRGIHQGIPARNSLKKVVDILSNNDKIKIIKKMVTNKALNKSRELEFLCIPSAREDHPVIQAAVQETLNALSVVYVKSGGSKMTPPELLLDYKPRTPSNKYGYGAKFNRLKVLHELVTYLVYHYDGKENLDPEENKKFVRPLLTDSESVDDLPTIYKQEISWKMFIPPLMPFEEYGDGWISQTDLAERLPLKLFLNLIRTSYDHPDLIEYLDHPIKRYYLLRHLPDHLRDVLCIDKKYIYTLCLNLRLLCNIGLCQFGPKNKNRGYQNLVYVNKKAQLLDTRLSPPGYYHVSSTVDYPCIRYNLTDPRSVEAYWNDALRFSVGTKLGRRKYLKESDTRLQHRRIPDRLTATVEARSFEEVRRQDNGEIPGNKLGAAGFDSWLFAFKHNQWFLNKYDRQNMEVPSPPQKTKCVPAKVPAKSGKPVSKLMRFRHKVIRNREYNRAKITYDQIDMDALSKLRTLRAQWSYHEDEILLKCHVASRYYSKPTVIHLYRPYILIRKILHTLSERSADKTVHACKRRIVNMLKNSLRQQSINLCLKEIANDVEMKEKFRALCKDIEKASNARNSSETKALLDTLTEEVFYHLYESKKLTVSTKGTVEFTLPDSLDTFRENFTYEYPTAKGNEKYLELSSKKEISTLLVVNLIFSALYSQVDKSNSLNAGFLYGVFKQFDDVYLKSALHFVRTNRLISQNKSINRNRGLLLPIGSGVFHLSLTYHLLLKVVYRPELFSCIYSRFLESLSHVDNENVKIVNFDAGLSTLLISHHMQNNVRFQIDVPESLLIFNEAPIVIDESTLTRAVVKSRKFSETTVSLVKELSQCEPDKLLDETDEICDRDENLVDDGDDEEEEDRLIDFSVSKISIYVTRNQFKHSDVRFSNAYDHFMLTPFSVSHSVDEKSLLNADCVNRTLFLDRLRKNVSFKKIRYSTNELLQKIRKCFHEPRERDFATSLMEFLLIKGVCGVSTTELANEFEDVRLLKTVVSALIRKKLIIRDGSVDTRFVHINFGETWLMLTCQNKNIFATDSSDCAAGRKPTDIFKLNESNDPLFITIRPWVHFDGAINEAALDSILTRVLSCIMKSPGLSLIGVQKKFLPALQPHLTRELLEFLEQLKCIRSYIFVKKTKPTLFSTSVVYTCEDEVHGFEDEDTIIYEPLPHAFVTFSIFLSSTNIKDLLEIKYSTDE